jgi:CheY-like chemotaxis protein
MALPHPATTRCHARTTEPRRVLVIEDNPDSRDTLRMLLELWGHTVETAEDGLAGLQKALTWQPEVAVVDIGLPGLNGLQVAQKVKEELDDRVRLIALTAWSAPDDRRRAMNAGFHHFMSKPADLNELARLVVA